MNTLGFGLGLFVVILFTPIASFGQSSDEGYMRAQNPQVTENEFYNTISIDIVIFKPDIEIDDRIQIMMLDFTIDNENGKKYYYVRDCGPELYYEMIGKNGPNGSFTVCYDVEKKFSNFQMYYKNELIGNINLNELEKYNEKIQSSYSSPLIRTNEPEGTECIGLTDRGNKHGIVTDGWCVLYDYNSDIIPNESAEITIQKSNINETPNLPISCGQGTELVDDICQSVKTEDVSDESHKEIKQESSENVEDIFSRLMEMLRSLFNFS